MSDLQASNCGQTLLKLVSKGNAIIAELLRLSDIVPAVFKLDSSGKSHGISPTKYTGLICDFGQYFKEGVDFEAEFNKKLEANPALQEFDEEFRENFVEIITKFYLCFESVHKYSVDLNHFIEDVENDVFIQQSLELLMSDPDGKQLLCESLFLAGVMLLVADARIDGLVRERILVSYYRYSASTSPSTDSNIDDVCNLLRSTGYSVATNRRPLNYPEEYFKRVKINPSFVNLLTGKLRTDDIYNLSKMSYPSPDHRSVAFSTQSSMLYVLLYFQPETLNMSSSVMREIVDKFFNDNWIISIYMGLNTVNLINEWENYKSAKLALSNVLDTNYVKRLSFNHGEKVRSVILPQIKKLLKEGTLNQQYVLENINSVMNTLREANVSLRWLMLHTSPIAGTIVELNQTKKSRQVREIVLTECKTSPLDVFKLLLFTAQLELRVKELYQELLSDKQGNWDKYKKESFDRINELSEVFSGTKPLTRIEKNAKLQEWFGTLSKTIESLSYGDNVNSSSSSNSNVKKIISIIQALEEVQEFHSLDSNLQVKQYIDDVKMYLNWMLKTISIKEETLIKLDIISDLTYSWSVIDNYTVFMQQGIQKDPSLVIKLRATFLKLSSTLDTPLNRLTQSSSPDLMAVSSYYSSELVAYVRKVLHIIPETMFKLMEQIISLQTNQIKELPTKLMKDQLKSYAQLDARYEVAKLTHSISVFTEGLLMMKTTLVGIIEINPKKLLEDGIRKELVTQVAKSLHEILVFNPKAKVSEIELKLKQLFHVLDGFKRSFEYIQDYIKIYGLKIWQEELFRIVNYNIEQECNSFMRIKILDFESVYQSKNIPIPRFPPLDSCSVNFIGRLARELLRITDPKTTIFVESMGCWYDNKVHVEVVNPRLFSLMMVSNTFISFWSLLIIIIKLQKSIGTPGLNGLDKLLSFMIHLELVNIKKYIDKSIARDKTWSDSLESVSAMLDDSGEASVSPPILMKSLAVLIERATKSWVPLTDAINRIGQMQILRCSIAHEVNTSCRFQSRHLAATLETFNLYVFISPFLL